MSQGYKDTREADGQASSAGFTQSGARSEGVKDDSRGFNDSNPSTLPSDFTLANTKAESKGQENVEPNQYDQDNESLSTAGRGGDQQRKELKARDIDLPEPQGGLGQNKPRVNDADNFASQGQGGLPTRTTGAPRHVEDE